MFDENNEGRGKMKKPAALGEVTSTTVFAERRSPVPPHGGATGSASLASRAVRTERTL